MRCEYKDGLQVDYSGSLRITRGKEIFGLSVRQNALSDDFRNELDKAVRARSCSDMRKIAQAITDNIGGKISGRVCIKE